MPSGKRSFRKTRHDLQEVMKARLSLNPSGPSGVRLSPGLRFKPLKDAQAEAQYPKAGRPGLKSRFGGIRCQTQSRTEKLGSSRAN